MSSSTLNRSLLSGRSQQKLTELHRAVVASLQELNQHHSVLVGALLGGDGGTQRDMLDEHRARAVNAIESLVRLGTFLDHCRIMPRVPKE